MVALISVAACSAADTSKTPLTVQCEPGSDDCPTTKHQTPKKDPAPVDEQTGSEAPPPTTPPATPPPATPPPATPPPALGAFCTKLQICCAALKKAGITGSARQCDEVVTAKSEVACSLMQDDFRTPDDSYDPPLGCL
jgi:hypothetical protein